MKKAARSKRNRMRHTLTGAGPSAVCVIALVIAITIGMQVPGANTPSSSSSAQQQFSQSTQAESTQLQTPTHPAATSTQTASAEPTSIETSNTAVIENEGATSSSPIQVVSNGEDGIAAEHQASVVLVKLPENLSSKTAAPH